MSRRIVACALAGVACAQASGPQSTFLHTPADPFIPNYAKRLLPPARNINVAPELLHMYRHFPIRVTVLDNSPLYSQRAFELVESACQKWVVATQRVRTGGVAFTYKHAPTTDDSDIVISLVTPNEIGKWSGFTTNAGAYQVVQLRVVSPTGEWLPYWQVQRVATHEIGHALGISGHSPDARDVMSEESSAAEVSLADVNTLLIAYGGKFR